MQQTAGFPGEHRLNLPSLSYLLPEKLVPSPMFKRSLVNLKGLRSSAVPLNDDIPLPPIPTYRREKATVQNYAYLCEKEFLEVSVFHLQDRLGRSNSYHMKLKLPPLRADFCSRAKANNASNANNDRSPQQHTIGFKHLPHVDKNQRKSEYRGTNTLTYSETLQQPSSHGNGAKSDANTLFKFTDKRNANGEEEMIDEDMSQLQENGMARSQEVGPALSKTLPNKSDIVSGPKHGQEVNKTVEMFIKDEDEAKSEHLNDSKADDLLRDWKSGIPEYHKTHFAICTDSHFVHVSSLGFMTSGETYYIPFAAAKIALKDRNQLQVFLQDITLSSQGKIDYKPNLLEKLKHNEKKRLSGLGQLTEPFVISEGRVIQMLQPKLRVFERQSKQWVMNRFLSAAEMLSIDGQLEYIDLDLPASWLARAVGNSDPLAELVWAISDLNNPPTDEDLHAAVAQAEGIPSPLEIPQESARSDLSSSTRPDHRCSWKGIVPIKSANLAIELR
jgi:hypothetical protein